MFEEDTVWKCVFNLVYVHANSKGKDRGLKNQGYMIRSCTSEISRFFTYIEVLNLLRGSISVRNAQNCIFTATSAEIQNGRYRKLVTRIYGKQLFCFSPILPWQFCVISCFLNLLNGDFAKKSRNFVYLDTIGAHFNIIDSS